MTLCIRLFILLLYLLPTACIASAHDDRDLKQQESSRTKKPKRKDLIATSARRCKIPCWNQSCQDRYPRCPLTKCNRDYDKTMRKLFYPGGPWDAPDGGCESYCVDCIRRGYGCLNVYKFLCPFYGMTAGRYAKDMCTQHLALSEIFHPRIASCAPATLLCAVQFGCSFLIKKCDYCILDALSRSASPQPLEPIEI